MFDHIFLYPWTIERHNNGPMAAERRGYLAHLAESGASRLTLIEAAGYLLAAAIRMQLKPREPVSIAQIEFAAERWARRPNRKVKGIEGPRRRFRVNVEAWLRFLGLLPISQVRHQPFAEQVQLFALDMEQERGLSPSTVRTRCWYVHKLINYLDSAQVNVHDVCLRHIEAAMASCANAGYTRGALRTYADSLRAFFRYAEAQKLCSLGISGATSAPRLYREESLPSGPCWADVQGLLASTETDTPKDIRDRAILILLAVYGLRTNEVRCLTLEDLDWDNELLSIRRSKQGFTQQYPLTRQVGNALLKYLGVC